MYINEEEIVNHISAKPFHLISEAAEELGVEVYVIGGYVRDIFLNRPSKDIDVVAVALTNVTCLFLGCRDFQVFALRC